MKRFYLLFLLFGLSILSHAQTSFTYASGGGSVQTYTVPAGVTSIGVNLAGGAGAAYPSFGAGGNAGTVQATINVTPGQVLQVYVGQAGVSANGGAGGSNSGGGAQGGNGSASSGGAGGGGASDIRTIAGNSTAALNSRLVVAAGGGGGSWDCSSGPGGAGGGLTGVAGSGGCGSGPSYVGQPGTPSGPGAGATSGGAGAGGLGYGGNGVTWGGGGGGGLYGGGGSYQGGGAGGSSYYGGTGVTAGTTSTGASTGNGYVVITALCSNPPTSTGILTTCVAGSTTLSNTTTPGTWSSASANVSVAAATGVVSGVTAGTAVVSYNVPGGCYSTVTVTVNARPTLASLTPSSTTVCTNGSLTLTSGAATGVGTLLSYNWSGPAGFAATSATPTTTYFPTSTSAAGIYSGTVVYSGSGCVSAPASTPSIAINTAPAALAGTFSVCQGATTPLGSTTGGGTWSSGSTSIATVAPSGVVTGVAAGLANISYTIANGCFATSVISVNPLPILNITRHPLRLPCAWAAMQLQCDLTAFHFSLLSQNFEGPLTGGWFITNGSGNASSWFQITTPPGYGSVTPGDGSQMLQAASASVTGYTSTRLTSPSFSTVGYGSANLSFNQNLVTVPPDDTVMVQYSIDGGTTWATLLDQLPIVSSGSGSWSAAASEATVAFPAAALGQANVKLRWYYHASSFYWFIDNISVNAALPPATYAWSGPAGLSCTTCQNPTITPATTGANNYNITATSFAGCQTTNVVTVNVNPQPAAITGNTSICVGTTTILNSTPGGTWASSAPGVASIVSGTGAITGLAVGTSNITYTLPTGCTVTTVVTVLAAPAAITGPNAVCQLSTITLSQAVSGGTWTCTNPNASVSFIGAVTGNIPGNATITYTLPSGCITTKLITINSIPNPIGGTPTVCEGSTTALTETSTGGAWSSSSPANATVNSSGLVSGILAGNAFITYTMPTTCYTTIIVTVFATPAAITGSNNVCKGAQTTLSSATPGGTWTSTVTTNATINSSGQVTGVTAGSTNIIYALSTGCQTNFAMLVNPLPNPITGANNVCETATTVLTGTPGGGTWASGSTSIAAVDGFGVVTGGTSGSTNITYTLATGCKIAAPMLVNPRPAVINGTPVICELQTVNMSDFTAGGTWSSDASYIASIDPATGTITGNAAGNATISYTLSTGCQRTVIATVNALPAAITGSTIVCKDMNTYLSDATGGGSWTTSNSGVAAIDAFGTVTGINAGNANITYTLSTGCARSAAIVVNPLPAAISGSNTVCEGATTPFTDATSGLTWTSLADAIASVDAASGVVTGHATGTTTITGTSLTGCIRTKDITVNPAPAAIVGSDNVCQGSAATMTDATINGVWSISSPSIASINVSGVVTGVSNGAVTVTYTLPEGCKATWNVVVNPLPGLISGPSAVCKNLLSPLTDATAGGNWISNNTAIATVNTSGIVTGVSAGNTTITYALPTGCYRTRTMTVNPLPAGINGIPSVCAGQTTALSDPTPGGTWSSTLPGVASVNSAGTVTGLATGVANIIYTLPTSCLISLSVAVNPQPAAITGPSSVCAGLSINLSDVTGGGIWSSSNIANATVTSGGVVSGVTGAATITYSLGTGCFKTKNITINPLPGPITGNNTVCVALTTSLGNASLGGTWSSSTPGVASINSSGLATGNSGGFTIITYTLPTGCINTAPVVVYALPAPITGNGAVCAGSISTLSDADGGGVWSSASAVANVSAAGDVTGVAAGTTIVTYSLGTGCQRTTIVTVNPLPELITGNTTVCPDAATTLDNDIVGGTWTLDNTAAASIDPVSGVVNGIAPGTAIVTYTLPTTCMRTKTITVNTPTEPITGNTSVCAGLSTTFASATTGGTWTSGNTSIATINAATGVASGVTAGNATMTYTAPTGCMATTLINVNALPSAIAGTAQVCQGGTTALSNMATGGTWTSATPAVATINPATGAVNGVTAGSSAVTYTLASGCQRSTTVVVNPLPAIDTVTGGGSYCAGATGMHIGLNASQTATTYKLYNASSSVITTAIGNNLPVDFGVFAVPGTYTVAATSNLGCSSSMNGSAIITVTPLTTPAVTVATASDTVCQGTAVTFSATAVNGGTAPAYAWHVGSGPTAGTASTFNATPADGDVISVTLTSSAPCPSVASVTATKQVTVMANLTPAVTIAAVPGNKICQGSSATFYATPVSGGSAPTYTWIAAGSPVSSVTGPVFNYTPASGAAVYCKIASNYRCPATNNVSSNIITLEVDSIYVPEVSILVTPAADIHRNTVVTFTTTVTKAGNSPTYQWLKNGGQIAGANAATFVGSNFTDGDSVTCVVTGTGACGYATINSVEVHVLPGLATGIAQTASANNSFVLMPNPNNGGFVINGTLASAANEEVSLEVTDVLGQIVYTGKVMARNGDVNERIQLSNNIANGMYILNLHTASEVATFHFVVKQ